MGIEDDTIRMVDNESSVRQDKSTPRIDLWQLEQPPPPHDYP